MLCYLLFYQSFTCSCFLSLAGLYQKMPKRDTDQSGISKGDDEDEEDEEENEEFQPSDGSENEMETEMLDYM